MGYTIKLVRELNIPVHYKSHTPDAKKKNLRANRNGVVNVPIPALASVSVLQSAAVGGSVVGVVGPL